MDKDKEFFKNEYSECFEFICQMQESAQVQLDDILSQKKELEHKKRQQEHLIETREKKKIPNISMFSPLFSDESDAVKFICSTSISGMYFSSASPITLSNISLFFIYLFPLS